jgi:hypothetical protein
MILESSLPLATSATVVGCANAMAQDIIRQTESNVWRKKRILETIDGSKIN